MQIYGIRFSLFITHHEVINYCFDPNDGNMFKTNCELLSNDDINKVKKIYEMMKKIYPDAKTYLAIYTPVEVQIDTKVTKTEMKWKPCLEI